MDNTKLVFDFGGAEQIVILKKAQVYFGKKKINPEEIHFHKTYVEMSVKVPKVAAASWIQGGKSTTLKVETRAGSFSLDMLWYSLVSLSLRNYTLLTFRSQSAKINEHDVSYSYPQLYELVGEAIEAESNE